jgi:hypothetical protein
MRVLDAPCPVFIYSIAVSTRRNKETEMITSYYPIYDLKTNTSWNQPASKSSPQPVKTQSSIYFIEEFDGEPIEEIPTVLFGNETPAVDTDEFEILYNWFIS